MRSRYFPQKCVGAREMLLRSIHSGSQCALHLSRSHLSPAAHAQMTFLPARKCRISSGTRPRQFAIICRRTVLWKGRLESLIECKISHLLRRRSTSSSPSRPLLRADHLLTATTRALNTGGSLSPPSARELCAHSLSRRCRQPARHRRTARCRAHDSRSAAPHRDVALLSLCSHRHYFISQPSIKTCCLWFCSAQCSVLSSYF